MGAIRERIDLTSAGTMALIRDYVGVSHTDSDDELKVFAMAAVDLAEQYIGSGMDHLDEGDPLPDAVMLWVLQYTAWRYERRDGRMAQREGGAHGVSVEWQDEPDYALLFPWRTVRV